MKFPDIIFVSMENWDEVWRRNQFICSKLARRYPDSKILFVGFPKDIIYHLRRGNFKEIYSAPTFRVPGFPNITVTRPLKYLPNHFNHWQRFNEYMIWMHVSKIAKDTGIIKPILWLNANTINP